MPTIAKPLLLVFAFLLAFPVMAAQAADAPANNTDADTQARLQRLENRMMALERRMLGTSGDSERSTMLADHEARIQALEAESSKIYGTAEEVGQAVTALAKKVELISSDIELRLQDLEQAKANGQLSPAPMKTQQHADNSKHADKEAAPAPKIEVPQGIDPEDMYKKAYDYMRKSAFGTAEAWFEAFIQRYPTHERAENAYYWLGEIYLVQKRPQDALVAFGNGIKNFPQGEKAPDSLLKMGVAFEQIGKPELAKTTWEKLTREYPRSRSAEGAKKRLENLK